MEKPRAVGAPIASLHPRSISHAQTGLPALLHPTRTPSRCQAVALCPFVRFTVTGVARNFHPYSLGRLSPASALIGRRCTRYSFSYSIVWIASRVKFYLSNALGTSHFSRFVIPCYRDQNGRILYVCQLCCNIVASMTEPAQKRSLAIS